MSWASYYIDRVNNESYERFFDDKYRFFLQFIEDLIEEETTLHEQGCGIGTVTKLLHWYSPFKVKSTVTDISLPMLNLTETNLDYLLREEEVNKHLLDILSDSKTIADITHGHGVIEHFSDSDIEYIIAKQKKHSKHIVHYVPTNKYGLPSFGDERLLPVEHWGKRFGPDEMILSNEGKDLLLYWKGERK